MNATTYAVDTAKNVMQLHWVDLQTGEIKRRKLSRAKFLEFFAQRQPARVVMEACGGAHHWGRALSALGWQAELLPAGQVRAFVRSNKDDAADARAIWLAAQHGDMRRVPIKSVEQQAVLSLHRLRAHWISVRTASINALRGLLYEFGVVLPKGKGAGLKALAERRAELQAQLPATMMRLLDLQLHALDDVHGSVMALDAEIAEVARANAAVQRLDRIAGVGVLGATALAASLGDGHGWKSGRVFAASLGLAPCHSGTGGKVRIGGASKRGDSYLRYLLINGARSIVQLAHPPQWVAELLERRPFNVVVVALAHKMARQAWALVAHEREFDPKWVSVAPIRQPA
jgi:transposase